MTELLQGLALLGSAIMLWVILTKRIRLPVISEVGLSLIAVPGLAVGLGAFDDRSTRVPEHIAVVVAVMVIGFGLFWVGKSLEALKLESERSRADRETQP